MAHRGGQSRDDDRADGGEIDLRALGRGIWSRKLWIVGPTLIAGLLAVAFVQLASPYYRSSALILIENREGAAPRSGERELALPDEQAVVSQVQLIQSRDLVRRVVKTLDLAADPEFAPHDGLIKRALGAIGLGGQEQSLPLNERIVDSVAQNLTVYPVTGSRVVGAEFVATDADRAARVVNGFVDAYLDIQRGAKREINQQASQYLSDEITNLRGRVGEAEDRVEAFRAKAGLLVGANNTTIAAQQLGDTSNQLSTSRTQQGEAQAKADTIRSALRQGRPAEALEIANSELVRRLAEQRSQLAAQIASEGRTLLPQHPRMRELSAQLGGLESQIRGEAEKLARAYENDAKTAGARVVGLQKQLDALKTTAATANAQDVQLRALEREARSQRDILEQMLTRYREATARDNPEALLADARVISRGAAATEPYFPKKLPTVALASLAAFVLSLFAVAATQVFGAQRRVEESEAAPPAYLETPPAAQLKAPEAAPRSSPTPIAPPADDHGPPTSHSRALASKPGPAPHARAIESADATLVAALARQLASMPTIDGALRILTTGATADLGVAGVGFKLASTISESGRRVVAVDAGGGAPNGGENRPGLSELLSGEATFAEAIHRDRGSRVHLVPQGAEPFDALDPSARSRLAIVLEALALTYDFVMLTTPSGPGGAEPFAAHCSAAVLVSNGDASDAATVEAHERLTANGIEDVVVLLISDGGGSPSGKARAAA